MTDLIAAGGWCAPPETEYDLFALSRRDYRAKYGWPEDHDPWEWMDADDISRIATIIEHGPVSFTEDCSGETLCVPAIRVPRGGIRFETFHYSQEEES